MNAVPNKLSYTAVWGVAAPAAGALLTLGVAQIAVGFGRGACDGDVGPAAVLVLLGFIDLALLLGVPKALAHILYTTRYTKPQMHVRLAALLVWQVAALCIGVGGYIVTTDECMWSPVGKMLLSEIILRLVTMLGVILLWVYASTVHIQTGKSAYDILAGNPDAEDLVFVIGAADQDEMEL